MCRRLLFSNPMLPSNLGSKYFWTLACGWDEKVPGSCLTLVLGTFILEFFSPAGQLVKFGSTENCHFYLTPPPGWWTARTSTPAGMARLTAGASAASRPCSSGTAASWSSFGNSSSKFLQDFGVLPSFSQPILRLVLQEKTQAKISLTKSWGYDLGMTYCIENVNLRT